MEIEKVKGPGNEAIFNRMEPLVEELEAAFLAGKPVPWPLIPPDKIHRVWDAFVRTGFTDDDALEEIYRSMRDNLVRLQISTIVAGHEGCSPSAILQRCEDQVDEFCAWLVDTPEGWRISDYGIKPLSHALALAFEARTQAAKLKYLDRALNVVHCRGDLSKFFVEGGRQTVLALPDLDETGPA